MLDDEHGALSAGMAEAFALQGSAAQLGVHGVQCQPARLQAASSLVKLSGDAARARRLPMYERCESMATIGVRLLILALFPTVVFEISPRLFVEASRSLYFSFRLNSVSSGS